MRAVLFEGTPEEFARVETMFRAGADPALQLRSIALPQSRPKAWPELDEEQCHRLAMRVLEQAPARLVDALSALAEAQNLSGDQTIEAWADYADRQPDELCGILAVPPPGRRPSRPAPRRRTDSHHGMRPVSNEFTVKKT